MNGTSRYFQVNPNILIEYIYTDRLDPAQFNTGDTGVYIMKDTGLGRNYFFFDDAEEQTFKNVRDLSSVLLDETQSRYGYLNIDKPTALNDELDRLTDSDSLAVDFATDYDIPYDKFRIHFASGYDFEGNDGFIVEAQVINRLGRRHNLSSITYLASDSYAIINPRPFLIGGAEYSSYVEVSLPAIYGLIAEAQDDAEDTDKLNSRLTNGYGIDTSEDLKFKVSTIRSSETINAQRYFNILDKVEFSIPVGDEFEGITANIEQAEEGDYFLLSAKFNGGSIQDYITLLNTQPNSNWVIINNLYQVEQIGQTLIETNNETWIQNSDFEEARFWRPVIRNERALSYTIDYTVRLFNRSTNEQIIKRAVETFDDVTKYGKSLKRIDLGATPVIDEIYNLVQGNEIKMQGFLGKSEGSVQYVPNFFDSANILIQDINEVNTQNGQTQTSLQNVPEKRYKQGELKIAISPFDNYLKFVLLTSKDNQINFFNLTQVGELRIAFTDNNNSQVSYKNLVTESVNPDSGEVLFYVPKAAAAEIQSYVNREFYIIIRTDNGGDNLVYSGTFVTESERTKENSVNYIQNLQNTVLNKNENIENLQETISRKDREIERLTALVSTKEEQIQFLKNPNSTIQRTSPAKANLQKIENSQSDVRVVTSQTNEKRKVDIRKKGNLLKNVKLNPNK